MEERRERSVINTEYSLLEIFVVLSQHLRLIQVLCESYLNINFRMNRELSEGINSEIHFSQPLEILNDDLKPDSTQPVRCLG